MSVKHILMNCPRFSHQRQNHNIDEKSISDIVGDEADTDALLGFCKNLQFLMKFNFSFFNLLLHFYLFTFTSILSAYFIHLCITFTSVVFNNLFYGYFCNTFLIFFVFLNEV